MSFKFSKETFKKGRKKLKQSKDITKIWLTLSKLKWSLEKLANIAFDVVAGYILYLIVGGYISQPLSEISPLLPTLLVVSLLFSVSVGFFYRLYKSIKFHRFIERTTNNLFDFLKEWDKLHSALIKAVESRKDSEINEFENLRAQLQYDFVANEVTSAVKVMKYDRIEPMLGLHIKNYDVIGNLLAESPFIKMREWFNVNYMYNDFKKDWDSGRTILVSSIGYFDKHRKNITHRLYLRLHLLPFSKSQDSE